MFKLKGKSPQSSLLKRILGGTFNYGLGSMMPKVIGFLLIPLYTSYLVPADYGIVEMCASIAVFVTIISRLGMTGSVTRFYYDHKDNPEELQDYVTTVHRFLMLVSIMIGLTMAMVFYFFGGRLTPGILFFPFISILLLNSALGANSDLQKRLLQCTEKSRYSALLSITNAFIGIVSAIFLVVVFKLGALGLMLSQMLTSVIFFVQAQFYLRSWTRGTFRPSLLRESLKYGMFTLPHHLFAAFAPLLSRLVLLHTGSLAALGLFALASRFIQPMEMIYAAFNQAWLPIYFSMRKENVSKEKIERISRSIWIASIGLYLVAVFLAPPIIPLITPERFHDSASIVPILAMGFIWQVIYFLVSIDLAYIKKNQYMTATTLAGMIVNLTVTLVFANKYGVLALAWAQVAGYMVWGILSFAFVKKFGEMPIGGTLIRDTLIVLTLSGIASKYLENSNLLLNSLALLSFSSIILLVNKKYIDISFLMKKRQTVFNS